MFLRQHFPAPSIILNLNHIKFSCFAGLCPSLLRFPKSRNGLERRAILTAAPSSSRFMLNKPVPLCPDGHFPHTVGESSANDRSRDRAARLEPCLRRQKRQIPFRVSAVFCFLLSLALTLCHRVSTGALRFAALSNICLSLRDI